MNKIVVYKKKLEMLKILKMIYISNLKKKIILNKNNLLLILKTSSIKKVYVYFLYLIIKFVFN